MGVSYWGGRSVRHGSAATHTQPSVLMSRLIIAATGFESSRAPRQREKVSMKRPTGAGLACQLTLLIDISLAVTGRSISGLCFVHRCSSVSVLGIADATRS